MNRQQKISVPMVGGSSLIVIFAVLCLTVFALLGLSTVQAGQRLTNVSAQTVLNYYTADDEAEHILVELRNGSVPDGVTEENGVYRYACAVSDTQVLLVEVCVRDTDDWEILRWQTVSSVSWQEDDQLNVWVGE